MADDEPCLINVTETIPLSYSFSDAVYGRGLLTSFLSLRHNKQFTDVTLKAGDKAVACHKVMLSAASPYFLAMFTSGLDECTADEVTIQGIDGATLLTIVDYIYSSDIAISTANVQSLIQACELLHFSGLKLACERFMLQQVDSTNCIGFYKFSKLYELKFLREGARSAMLTMFKDVVAGIEFKEMTTSEVVEYIADNELSIRNEDPLFDAVKMWLEHHVDQRQDDLCEVISHVRFPFCTTAYLCDVVERSPLLTANTGFLDEARHYHMLPEKRHEMRGNRFIPRKSFGVTRKLVLVGGLTKGEKENRYCWYLKEDTDTWDLLAQLPKPNWKFYSICVTQSGICVTGGYHGNVKRECWLFDTGDKKWKSMAAMLDARCKHRTVVVGDSVYVVGGEDDFDRPLSSVERLNSKAKQHWEPIPAMTKSLSDPLVVSLGRYIYVFGGIEDDDTTSTSTLAFDTVWDTWSQKADMPEACRLGSVATINNKIYIVGGYSLTCMSYEPRSDTWTSLNRPREKHGNAPAVVWKGKILVGGGDLDLNETTSVVEEYNPDRDEWAYWKISLKEELSCHYLLNVELNIL